MSTKIYWAYNGAQATSASPAKVTTGTSIKTLQQLAPPANGGIEVIEWGIQFDGSAAATPGICELLETGAINATVTAYVAADLVKFSNPQGDASRLTTGTSSSGYTSSAEGSIVAGRQGDAQLLPPTAPYLKQFPLERGFELQASDFGRIRVLFGTAINAISYICWAE